MADPAMEGVLEWDQVKASMTEEVDAVIVGTGCGGAVMAKELAAAGKKVLMLERGGLYTPERGDFDQREDDMLARIDGGRGLHSSENTQAQFTYGNCVGGASVHYWAETWRTPKDRCELWASKYGVEHHSHDELLPFFERIEADLHAHKALPEKRNVMNQLFMAGADKAGIPWEEVVQARDARCIGSGYCVQGCTYNGKQSQLITHLPMALKAGARIYADCEVEQLNFTQGRAVGLSARFLDRRTNKPSGHTLEVKAKVVIVSAGGFNSAPLLMRSKVPDPSGQLGKNFQFNPCPQLYGLFDRDIVLWRNIPCAVGSMEYRLPRFDGGKYLEGGYLLYPNQLTPAQLGALMPGFGKPHRALMEQLHRVGSAIAWIDDQGSGSVRLDDDGRPIWSWEMGRADELIVRDALKKEATVLLHAGAREIICPDPRGTRLSDLKELSKIDTIDLRPGSVTMVGPHPAGMCRMGKDPATSVVNSDHEVHSVKGLFVCDPSVFPTAVSVDPSESIMAFSYVAAGRLLQNWGKYA